MDVRPLTLALALLATACSDIGSSSLLTSGMSAVVRGVSINGESTDVSTVLRAGGVTSTTFVKLEGGDDLAVTVGGQTVPLVEASLGPLTSYRATVQTADPSSAFVVALTRVLDDGAPSTTFTLPEPFALTTDPAEIDPTEPVQIAWEPSASTAQVLLEVSGECVAGGIRDLAGDDGVTTIPSSMLERFAEQPGVSYPVTVTISKIKGGQLDPAYGEGGSAQGVQSRSLSFTISFD
jgi:hypothetical protein